MALQLYTNNAFATIAAGISSSATSVTLTSGEGALFPIPTSPQYFRATFVKAGNSSIKEEVKVTAASGDAMTIVRAQEGSTALTWATGDSFNLYFSAAGAQNFAQIDDLQAQAPNYAADTGSANAYSVTLTPALAGHVTGMPIRWKAGNSNTGACTFNDGVSTASLVTSTGAALVTGLIIAGSIYECCWNGSSAFQLSAANIPSAVSMTSSAGQTAFTLANSPTFPVIVVIDGATLSPSTDYIVSGSTLTLTNGTLAGQSVSVFAFG